MKFKSVGIDPDAAANYVTSLYDAATTDEEKVKMLLTNMDLPLTMAPNTPKILASMRSIDITVGEMLSIALTVMFYNYHGEANGNTYQAVVGVEDSQKRNVENVLSDGGIYEDKTGKRMVFQQVTAQGYYPQVAVCSKSVADMITKKVDIRDYYPEHCGLIINIYSTDGEIEFREIASMCDLASYDIVFGIVYSLPRLDQAVIVDLNAKTIEVGIPLASLTINLERHPVDESWIYNLDEGQNSTPPQL